MCSISVYLCIRLPEYITALSSIKPVTPTIVEPLQLEPLNELLSTARICLDNNFVSSFLTLVGSIVAFHYTSVLTTQDECPLILCYSKESGTGMLSNKTLYGITLIYPHPHREVNFTQECTECVRF